MPELRPEQRADLWNELAEDYDTVATGFTRFFAEDAVRLLDIRSGMRVLDVATGTGTAAFAAAARQAEVLATDFSPRMVEFVTTRAAEAENPRVVARLMDGQKLELDDASFDAALSVFGLMLFPDRAAGFRELHRVLKPGGKAAVVAWSVPSRLGFFQQVMQSLLAGVPELPPKAQPDWVALGVPEVLQDEMRAGGFARVNCYTVRHVWTFPSPEWLWDHLDGLAPGYSFILEALSPSQLQSFGKAFVARLINIQGDGPYALEGEAHIAVAKKAG